MKRREEKPAPCTIKKEQRWRPPAPRLNLPREEETEEQNEQVGQRTAAGERKRPGEAGRNRRPPGAEGE